MTPGARAAAAIELLEAVEGDPSRPADAVAAAWFRQRRYIGGGDRRAISSVLYDALRRRAQIDWWLDRAAVPSGLRGRVIAALMLGGGWAQSALLAAFDGGQYRPEPLSEAEQALAAMLEGQGYGHPDQPLHVRGNIPAWMEEEFRVSLGDSTEAELAALLEEAPVDLRVNGLKADRDTVARQLADDGIEAVPTPFSPVGLRLAGRINLGGSAVLRDGLAEPQDESSQLVALLSGAKPGDRAVDFCAGAGGKTLALAAMMQNRGRITACDTSPGRLARAQPRLERAGVTIAETALLEGEDGLWPGAPLDGCDLVLVDAPCSGTGTWRRNPAARWRINSEDFIEYTELQGRILASAARLVAPGGRLVYAVCSLLAAEGEGVVTRFLSEAPEFAVFPASRAWRERIGGDCPGGDSFLRMRPGRDGADGFFIALLNRQNKDTPLLSAQ